MPRLTEKTVHSAIDGLVGAKQSAEGISSRTIQKAIGYGAPATILKFKATREAALKRPTVPLSEFIRREVARALADPANQEILFQAMSPTDEKPANVIQKRFKDIEKRLAAAEVETNITWTQREFAKRHRSAP